MPSCGASPFQRGSISSIAYSHASAVRGTSDSSASKGRISRRYLIRMSLFRVAADLSSLISFVSGGELLRASRLTGVMLRDAIIYESSTEIARIFYYPNVLLALLLLRPIG